jgi:tetratricopeptide (TPR) repeat protein
MQGVYVGVIGAFFAFLMRLAGIVAGPWWLAPLAGGAVGFLAGRAITRALFSGGERLAKQIVLPDAPGTYAPQHSHIEALEAQERYGEAFDAWMQVAGERPGNPSPLLRAADLRLRQMNDPDAALELYERVRRLPGLRDEPHRYASQKIIDIHLRPGGDHGRALVELRRFVETFPEGREAEGARAAIARLKGERQS